MVEQAGALPGDAQTSLADSRAQFIASLGRRLEALRQALFALEQAPRSPALRDHLRRRIHAFGAAAGVLGFDRVFEAFREAENVLGRAGATPVGSAELGLVARTVDLVPSLVLGTGAQGIRDREGPGSGAQERRGGAWPISVLVFGAAAFAEPLDAAAAGGASVEWERTEDATRAEEIVRVVAPDVAVIDADRSDARALIETLAYDPLLDPVRIVAVGSFERPEAAANLVALGVARVLPKPTSAEALLRSVLEVARERSTSAERIEPLGDMNIEALGERLAQEIRRGLVDATKSPGRDASVSFGEGADVLAAVWASVARIRELVTLRSGGAVQFLATGPEGAVPLAPWMNDDRSRLRGESERRTAEGVKLSGRSIVVVDDDPAIVWFLSGLLRAAGAEVLEAHDGERALELVRDYWPDLVVSDILMPGLDGFALCRELKHDVVLSDIPVILLSWKEDLLQRMRELGAEAAGYLRKEATASAVVQRVREVLLPRARVEVRIAAGGGARGRLDGLTPRVVLEIVCSQCMDARVTIRDAAYLYEVEVRAGRVRKATRTTAEGRSETGMRALTPLLGVRAGRFAVTPDSSSCAAEWDVDLRVLLAEPVERARAAQRALSDLGRVARVDIEQSAAEPYLRATPTSAGDVVRRLTEHASPAEVISGGASPRLVDAVLADLVLHGALVEIVDTEGRFLLTTEIATSREGRARRVRMAKDFRTPAPPMFVARSPTPPPASPASASFPDALVAAFEADKSGSPSPLAEPVPPTPSGADELRNEFAALFESVVPPAPQGEKRTPSRTMSKGLAPPTSAPVEPSPLETALRSLPASVAARVASSAAVPPDVDQSALFHETLVSAGGKKAPSVDPKPSIPNEPVAAPAAPAPPAPPADVIDPPRVEARPRTEVESPKAASEGGIDLGDAVLSALGDDSTGDRPSERERQKREPRDGQLPTAKAPMAPAEGAAGASGAAGIVETPPRRADAGAKGDKVESDGSLVGIVAVLLLAAASTFALVSTLRSGTERPPAESPAGLAPSAPPAVDTAAPGSSVGELPASSVTSGVAGSAEPQDLPLPSGIIVSADRGLLEIDALPEDSIYVDGVLIGRGPQRQLPLGPGPHEVRVEGGPGAFVRTVDVKVGRRVRIGTTNAP